MPGMKMESILKQDENKTLEFKENSEAKQSILKSIVAFLIQLVDNYRGEGQKLIFFNIIPFSNKFNLIII